MSKIQVSVKSDFIESVTTASPLVALSELIWNGFDAGAGRVSVLIYRNELGGVDSIRVVDDGSGIDYDHAESFFGNLGNSWKKSSEKLFGRSFHGKNGRGRFKAFSLGEKVTWNTVYKKSNSNLYYSISGNANYLENFEVSQPKNSNKVCGTEVFIENTPQLKSLLSDDARLHLCKLFATYLTEYPNLILEFDGERVDPIEVQLSKHDYNLAEFILENGSLSNASISIIEWKMPSERNFYFCDSNGISLAEAPVGSKIRAAGFNFSIYIKSSIFSDLESKNQLSLANMNNDVQNIIKLVTVKVKSHFRALIAKKNSEIVRRWKEEKIYPYDEKESLTPVEQAERQMFEILAVNVESYMASFEDFDVKSKRFTFKLLAQAVGDNPESVQKIITEVLGLSKEKQDELAELLENTTLSDVISCAKIITDRLNFLEALESLLFNSETKKSLLERDQLHKILEKETWIFDEDFTFSKSEQRLDDILKKHLGILGGREDLEQGLGCRFDLMFQKAVQPRADEYDYLVVELKRPSKKIDSEVITQLKKYAMTVSSDERLRNLKIKWKFIAISTDLDSFAKDESQQREKPKGQIYDSSDKNVTAWVKTWSEIIGDARSKLKFINDHLQFEVNNDSSVKYLKKTHEKFIPILEFADGTNETEVINV